MCNILTHESDVWKTADLLLVAGIKQSDFPKYMMPFFALLMVESRLIRESRSYIVYSDSQEHQSSNSLNEGLSEKNVLQNFKLAKNGTIIVVDKLQTGFDEPYLHTLFLDKEIRGINAIQTISRVNRTLPPKWKKHDRKIVDFSYKNINVKNIKAAFEHFSNVVVSCFDPLGDEEKLGIHYEYLLEHEVYNTFFPDYNEYRLSKSDDVRIILTMEEGFGSYIRGKEVEAKNLKKTIGKYFRILNLIEFVIELNSKFSERILLDFWRSYNKVYNLLHRQEDIIDDVEIYFDNQIGIVAPIEPSEKKKTPKNDSPTDPNQPNKFKYNILRVIEKRNQEEKAISEMILEFEKKIDGLFEYIKNDNLGKRLIAKINDGGSEFSQDEIYSDFERLYRKYLIINKNLGEFFKRETRDILNQLCDDFERTVKI